MIDINYVRNHADEVRELVRIRGCDVDVGELLRLDVELRAAIARRDELRHERNTLAGPEQKQRGQEIKAALAGSEQRIAELTPARDRLWEALPNLLAPDSPAGHSDADNVELRKWGTIPQFSFEPQPHDVIGSRLDILDLERGAQVAASGFYYWKGDGARLASGLFALALDLLQERGFVQMFTPVVAQQRTLFGTGYLPFFADQIYRIEGTDLSLIGTSEQTLLGYHIGEILPESSLPLCYTAFSPCFRTESGAYGRKSRGAFRVHQFHKVEQIVVCRPEESEASLDRCQTNIEDLMQILEIPYRVVRVCTGDLGAPAYKKYDVEGWFAGFSEYRETHSNSNLLDYQSRRLGLRVRNGKTLSFPHTISATMITDRALLAILENNQQEDGSVVVPQALRRFVGGRDRITPSS